MIKDDLKILIISNNCLSSTNSNGRTIFSLVSNLKNEQVANFYIKDEIPDCEVFTNFYNVSDQEALRAFKTCKKVKVGRKIDPSVQNDIVGESSTYKSNAKRKNPFGSIAREIVWNSKRWVSEEFIYWIRIFSPNVILLQAGDAPFLFKLARKLSKKEKIPLIIHSCEDYYFKKFNYMSKNYNWLYPIFHSMLVRQMNKAIKHSANCIYNSEDLSKAYQHKIKHNASVIMNGSAFDISKGKDIEKFEKITYVGNLGLGRHKSLFEIGQVLSQSGLKLSIYGPLDEKMSEILKDAPGLKYEEMVSYERVKEIILDSDLLVQVESFEDYALKDLKHSFSTKIGDYLGSGVPLFVYAPKGMTSTDYIYDFVPSFVATSKVELVFKLNDILEGKTKYPYEEVVRPIVEKNHLQNNNQTAFNEILCDAIEGEKNGR